MYGPIKLFHIQNICSWILVLAAAVPVILGSGDSCVCWGQSWQKSPNTTTIRIHCAESHSCWVPRKQTLSGGFDCTSAIGTWLGASLWSYPQEVCPLFRFFFKWYETFSWPGLLKSILYSTILFLALQVSKFRRLAKRAKGAKMKTLLKMKEAARKLGWPNESTKDTWIQKLSTIINL